MKSFSVISLVAIIALAGESYAQYKLTTSYKAKAGGSYKAPAMGSKIPATPMPAVDYLAVPKPSVDYPAAQMPGSDYPGTDLAGSDYPGSQTPSTDYPGADVSGEASSGLYDGAAAGGIDYSPEVSMPAPVMTKPVGSGRGRAPINVGIGRPVRGGGRGGSRSGNVGVGPIDSGIGGSFSGSDYPSSQMPGSDYPGSGLSGEASPDYSPEVSVPIANPTIVVHPIRGRPARSHKNFGNGIPMRGGGRGNMGQPNRGSGSGSGSGSVDFGPINGGGSIGGANGSGSASGSIDGPLANGSIGGSVTGEDYTTPAPVDAYPGNAVSGCGGAPAPVAVVGGNYVPKAPVACPLTSKPSYPTKIEEPYVAKAPVKEYTKSKYTKPAMKY